MNLGGVSYWQSQTIFNDVFKGSAGNSAEYPPIAGEGLYGFPTAINPALDQCAGGSQNYLGNACSYWVPGMCGLGVKV